jgi:hypothetical protein
MEIELKLEPTEVQLIINALANLPYGQVRGVIEKVVDQANAQTQQEKAGTTD